MESEGPKENETKRPILELRLNPDTKISFLKLDQFDSPGLGTTNVHQIPAEIEEIIGAAERSRLAGQPNTYSNTVQGENWNVDIYNFVNRYARGEGKHILDRLGVQNITHLTPKQAIEFTALVLMDLTKYKRSDAGPEASYPSVADKSTVLELLQDGLVNRGNPSWEGNGVCRNFAWMGKAMLESLRDSIPGSTLSTTYSLYDAGYAFAPKRQAKYDHTERSDSSHAWDTYLVLDPKGNIDVTVVDFTWVGDSSKGLVDFDHTRERVEPLVFELAQKIEGTQSEKERELKKVFEYYADNIQNPGDSGYSGTEDFRAHFATRVLTLIKATNSYEAVPVSLKHALTEAFQGIADQAKMSELDTLYQIMPGTSRFVDVLQSYLRNLNLSAYRDDQIYSDNPRLQREVLTAIQNRPDFPALIKESGRIRARCREVGLGDLLPPFDPTERVEDARELKYLLDRSGHLNSLSPYRPGRLSPEKLSALIVTLRSKLKELNPALSPNQIDITPGYALIANFDSLAVQGLDN